MPPSTSVLLRLLYRPLISSFSSYSSCSIVDQKTFVVFVYINAPWIKISNLGDLFSIVINRKSCLQFTCLPEAFLHIAVELGW